MRGVRVGLHRDERRIADSAVIRLRSFAVVIGARHWGIVWNTPVAVQVTSGPWTPIVDVTRLLEVAVMCFVLGISGWQGWLVLKRSNV